MITVNTRPGGRAQRRRMAGALRGTVVALAVAMVAAGCAASTQHSGEVIDQGRAVTVGGLTYDVPDGWTTSTKKYFCSTPADHTVAVVPNLKAELAVPCAANPPPQTPPPTPTYVIVQPLRPGAGQYGQATTWHGRSATLATDTLGRGATATLTVPEAHAQVIAQAPDAAAARALLANAHPA